jgi:hypothetical protein
MASNDVIVRLRMLGAAAFESAAKSAAGEVLGIGEAADKTQAKTDDLGKSSSSLKGKLGKLAKLTAVAGGLAAVGKAAKDAFGTTEDLAKSTMALQRSTGLDAKQASAWAEVTKVRGISTKQLQVGFVKLSKTMEAARGGNEKATASLQALGVNMDQIQKGDITGAISRTADAFALMTNPAQKAATAQALFGKQGQALLPLLSKGSAGLNEQLGLATKYGAVIDGKTVKSTADLIAKQREMKIATDGLKVTLGTALIPIVLQVATVLSQLVATFQPLLRDATLMKVLIVAVTAAFLAYKIAMIASTIATLAFNAAFLLIPLAVLAVVAALVLAYTKVKWFRDAVNAAIAFIKNNWKLLAVALVAPWALLPLVVARNFNKIKGLARSLVAGFKNLGGDIVRAIVNGIKSAPGAILGAIKSILPGGKVGKIVGKALGFAGLQTGGILTAGSAIVGERGPELVSLSGGAARVTPLPGASVAPVPALSLAGGTTVAKVYLGHREVAQAVAQHTSDVMARR